MKHWNNRETNLFLVTYLENKPLPYVTVKIIEWDGRTKLEKDNGDILLRNASVTLECRMPYGIETFDILPGAELHLLHGDCGPSGEYFSDDLIIVLGSITHEYRAIRDAVIVSVSDVSKICLEVVFRCDVRLVGLA